MFKLIKLLVMLFCLFGVAYLLLGVSFGDKTLYEHLLGISKTDEAETLKTEIEKKIDNAASDLKSKASSLAKEELEDTLKKKSAREGDASQNEPSKADRESLNALIKARDAPPREREERESLNHLIRERVLRHPQ